MGEQGLDDFFFARVKAKKLLHIETGIHRDDPQQSRSFISIDFSPGLHGYHLQWRNIQYQGLEQIHLTGIPEMVALAVVRGVLDDDIYKKLGH